MGVAAIPNRGRLPSILLARRPRFTDSRNDTTATAESKDGYTMGVSFWMAEPPQLSLLSIHCTKPHDLENTARSNFSSLPHVVGADGPFVLLRAIFRGGGFHEYFLYKAGAGAGDAPPSLERIPSPYELGDANYNLSDVRELGILGHRGDHYLLASLHDSASSDDYQLRIYSSETKSWSTRTLHNPCPGVDRVIPDKVITLGQGGLLGWVDLLHGLLVCDLLLLLEDQDPPVPGAVSFIPLPEPLPGNRHKLKYPIISHKVREHPFMRDLCSASWFRDLACVDGVLKFVEMENPPPENKDTIIYDSDLITSLKRKAVDRNSMKQLSSFRDAWRAVTWSRKVSSSNFWRQTCAAHVADIKGQELTFRDLYSAFPILSPGDGDDILYLKSMVEPSHKDGSVAAVDIGNKALKAIGHYYLPDDFYYNRGYDPEHPFFASTLSRHLDLTPGNQVSACRKKTEAKRSANHPIIRVDSSEQMAKIPRLLEMAGKTKRARNSPVSIMENNQISQVRPVENNLPQKHKLDAAPVHSLWPHQNILAPQPWFNNCNVDTYHGYSQLSAPNSFAYGAHTGYGNYQQQSLQLPPTLELPVSASCLHPHSQQLSAPNLFAYGVHTGYGNYQQQWPQLPPTLELPVGASWQQPPPPGSGAASSNTS